MDPTSEQFASAPTPPISDDRQWFIDPSLDTSDHIGSPSDASDAISFSQDSSSSNLQLKSTFPLESTLASGPFPQGIPSANSPTIGYTFNVGPSPSQPLGTYPV